ncbi:hypothetical protein IQ251_10210 [Saccharopolyspora sp. HNM0983]|uniref:Uncharacterized protein n=1 Tax=Saccharopolyspora montiporae TaxID=2781240 RepID=A0A929BC53_9PSEU|nr:hypothetical protein [Saccharopolyspora sp. HNM0983]MBE9374817.1 hypothetical protein [Saccharopolyspora sp. HNM0983]
MADGDAESGVAAHSLPGRGLVGLVLIPLTALALSCAICVVAFAVPETVPVTTSEPLAPAPPGMSGSVPR